MKIGLYDRWLSTLGGGERMALALAECLAADHEVEVIAHHAVDLDTAAAKLNLDLRRVRLRCVPELPTDDDYAPLTAGYDLFIAASQTTFIPARARHSWLLAFFPYPIDLSASARARRRIGLMLRRQLLLPIYTRGFYGAELEGDHLIRWTDGHGVIRLPISSGTIKVRLSIKAATHTEVRVNGKVQHPIEPTPDRGFVPITLDVAARDQSATIEMISAGQDQSIGTRAIRPVGAAIREVLIDHWRYRLYQQLFERRFKHWGLRLLNIPSAHGAAAVRSYSTVIGISHFTQDWIRRYWLRDSELLYPPVEVAAFQPGDKRNIILTVGRIFAGGHNKKHLPMIETFKQLVDAGLRDWEFHIAGSVGDAPVDLDYFAQVQKAAQGYPIVVHTDVPLATLQDLYGAAKIYWHAGGYGEDEQRDPIKFEHFGITTVEAMAAGAVPIVIGKAGQLEVVEHAVSGLHWQTLVELAAHTRRVIADEAVWSRLSRNAIERSRTFSRAAFDARARIDEQSAMIDQPTVAVIVVNWNGRAYLEKCLSALRVQTYRRLEIVLVDNASTDDSVAFVRTAFPEVTVIQLDHNLGFAAGNNAGIRATHSDYVALINNDAYVEPHWLAKLIEVIEQRPDVGLLACKVLFDDDPRVINSAGLALDWAGFCWDWRGGQLDQPAEMAVEEVFGSSGAAAMYRRSMLDEIGLFDEDFFMYAEDADLNWRAQRAGWKCLYVPAARVRHVASASSIEGSRFKTYHLGRNKIWLLIKNVPTGRYLWWWFILIGYDLMTVGWGLIARRDTAAVAGRWAALRGLRRMWGKRSQSPTRTTAYLKLLKPLAAPWHISARFKHTQARRQNS